MNEQALSVIQVLAITAVLSIGLGVIVWQIFRSEAQIKKDKKA
jgi:hypothetical protein